MKQFFAIMLSVFYLLTALGISVSVHYCHGHIQDIEFFGGHGSCPCSDMGLEMPAGCCDDKTFKIDKADEEYTVQQYRLNFEQSIATPVDAFLIKKETAFSIDEFLFRQVDLPPPKSQPLWLLNVSLTYYG